MSRHLIGIISDTHGLLRPEAIAALQGVEMILHAGDIGKPEILESLENLAPIAAVRGNNDRQEWANEIPETQILDLGGVSIYMLHDLKTLNIDPQEHQVVISGHSHKPLVEMRDGVMYLNPGSAGPRRFKLPVSIARLTIDGGVPAGEIVDLAL